MTPDDKDIRESKHSKHTSVTTSVQRKSTYEQVCNTVPEELRQQFEMLVDDYKFSAHVHHGKQFVSYVVLADLIKAGWRRQEQPSIE